MAKLNVRLSVVLLLVVLQVLSGSCVRHTHLEHSADKVHDLIAALTIDEKIALIVGVGDGKTPPPGVPVYDPKSTEILDFQSDGKPVGKADPRKARLDVIEKTVKMGDKLQPNGI